MPLRQYFAWVGSVLLVALLVADWCLPAPAHPQRSELAPNQRVNLQIRSDRKWPDKVVFDTTPPRSASVADAGRQPEIARGQITARTGWRTPLDALAAMLPAALPSPDRRPPKRLGKPGSRRFQASFHDPEG